MRIFYLLLVIALALGSNQIGAQNSVDKGDIMQLSLGLRTNTVQPLFDLNRISITLNEQRTGGVALRVQVWSRLMIGIITVWLEFPLREIHCTC